MRRRALATLMLLVLASMAAWAQTFSKRKMEDLVQQILEQRTGIRAAAIECPVATPIGIGNRAVCTATGPEGATFSVEIIQKDEQGGVNFTVSDTQALEALEPAAEELVELWKAGELERIYREGNAELHELTRLETFAQLLQCTAADLGGVEAVGETEGAAIHRGDDSGQIITTVRFGDGPASVTLNYRRNNGGWKLRGISMPVKEIDPATVDTESLARHAARLFERIDADDWPGALDMLSYELRGETSDADIRAALDDPWDLGPVSKIEITAQGRNKNKLPFVVTRLSRERGEQRAWMVFRSCGVDWKVRVMQLLEPSADLPLVPMSAVQTDIVTSLAQQQGVEVSLECPGSEIAILPGITYTCQAAHASGLSASIEITVGDEGGVSWELLADDSWDPLFVAE